MTVSGHGVSFGGDEKIFKLDSMSKKFPKSHTFHSGVLIWFKVNAPNQPVTIKPPSCSGNRLKVTWLKLPFGLYRLFFRLFGFLSFFFFHFNTNFF